MTKQTTSWRYYSGPYDPSIKIKRINHFDARGMKKVYHLSSQYPKQLFYLSIWQDCKGHMYARFWSRCIKITKDDWESYEIIGSWNWGKWKKLCDDESIEIGNEDLLNWGKWKKLCDDESIEIGNEDLLSFVPDILRDAYDNWILDNLRVETREEMRRIDESQGDLSWR